VHAAHQHPAASSKSKSSNSISSFFKSVFPGL
jgi:hypothetical protein